MTGYLKLSDFSTRGIEQLTNEITLQVTNYINENDISGTVNAEELIDNLTIKLDETTGKIYVDFSQLTSLDISSIDGLETFVQDMIDVIEFPSIEHNHDDSYATISHTHTASEIAESSSKVFVTASQRSQVDSNTVELNSHSQRISEVENELSNITTTDEKVKMNTVGASGYLEDMIDNITIQSVGGKLSANTLIGLVSTIQEINELQGVNGNIQAQINALSNIGNFSTSVDTHADLNALFTQQTNDMVIVLSDESKLNSPTTIYIYNGTDWIFSGDFKGGEIRDFTTNPLNLNTETTGVLPKTNYEKPIASEIAITDASGNLIATNVEDAFAELFTYANNIKSIANIIGTPLSTSDTSTQMNTKTQQLKVLFANYLTQKGVVAYPYNTLEELINKIVAIPNITIEGTIKKVSKLNITAPYELRIVLDEAVALSDITTTLIEFVRGATGVVHYDIGFNNGDASDFEPNDKVDFDGVMKLKTVYTLEMVKDDNWTDKGSLHEIEINVDDWLSIDKLNVISGEN